jgi:putative lipoprotein
MQKILFISGCLLLASLLAACQGSSQADSVTGTVTYLVRIALPEDAVVTVRLQDISLADAPAELIGEQVIETKGKQVPIPYEIEYDATQIKENNAYSISARIEDSSGKLLFISDTVYPVITRGNPTSDVEVLVVQP